MDVDEAPTLHEGAGDNADAEKSAMHSVEEDVKDPLLANWVKSSLALNITNEVMRPFAVEEIKRLHQTILSALPDGALCTSCTVKTAKYCRRGICSHIKREIKNHHWFPDPSFGNTNVESWCTDSWEIAKCYMPKGKDYKNSSAEDADFSTTINVIINCQHFKSFGTCDPNLTKDKYFKGKTFRNDVMHSKSMRVPDDEMKTNLDNLIDILEEISTPTIKDDVDHAIREINKIKDNKVTLKMEQVLKETKQALEIQGFTPAMIQDLITEMEKQGKRSIDEHVQQGILDIQREKEQVHRTSLIPNFVEGCQVSLQGMTYKHIMNQRPEDMKPKDWTVPKFLTYLKLHREKCDLSDRHRDMLFPASGGTPVDIKDWDIFLFCFILIEIELPVPIENSVKCFVKEAGELRELFLRDPESVKKSRLMDLCQYVLDADLKKDMTEIFNKTFTSIKDVHSNNILTTWDRDDERYRNTAVSQRNLEASKEVMLNVDRITTENIKEMKEEFNRKLEETNKRSNSQFEELKRLLSSKNEEMKEMLSKIKAMNEMSNEIEGLTQQVHKTLGEPNSKKIKSSCRIEPRGCNDGTEQAIQGDLTKPDSIGRACGGIDKFEADMNVEDAVAIHGSIILEVTCSSIKGLIDFWDGCMDGRAVKALEKVRDIYREHFKCSTLEFDVILPKKEVSRCMHQIVEDLPSQLCGKRLIQEVDDTKERLTPTREQQEAFQADVLSNSRSIETLKQEQKSVEDLPSQLCGKRLIQEVDDTKERLTPTREHQEAFQADVLSNSRSIETLKQEQKSVEDLPSQLCGKRLIQEVDDTKERLTPTRGFMNSANMWQFTKAIDVASAIGMVPHPEGGYFIETYRSGSVPMTTKGQTDVNVPTNFKRTDQGAKVVTPREDVPEWTYESLMLAPGRESRRPDGDIRRNCITSIIWMPLLSKPTRPLVGYLSDHVHYYQGGNPSQYTMYNPQTREFYTEVLGPAITEGQQLQVVVPGGVWKCGRIVDCGEYDFSLIGEAVSPGFDFHDFSWVTRTHRLTREDIFRVLSIFRIGKVYSTRLHIVYMLFRISLYKRHRLIRDDILPRIIKTGLVRECLISK